MAAPPTEPDSRVKPAVFVGSSVCIIAITIWAMVAPDSASDAIATLVGWISDGLGWYYFLAATLFLGFVIYIAASRHGKIRLGPEESRPDFSLFAWGSMLFAAGIGIDLMFFSVAEPVAQYLEPPAGDGQTVDAARQAVVWTLFHYGVTGWAMYALMGMALAYFVYRHNLPLSVRSVLYPVFGERVNGPIGHAVDIAAVLGTIFGIATSLGIGVVQLNYGLDFQFGIPQGTPAQIGLILVAVAMVTASAVAGIDKGLRRMSELNVVAAVALMVFILVTGSTVFLLNGLVLNVGDYVSRFPGMTLNTFAFDRPTEWLNSWTLFFWAWWVAWAPFVGLFLARISRGRTIRQFVLATLIVPFLFILIWISIFGNSALAVVREGNPEFGQAALDQPQEAFYGLLSEYPLVSLSAGVATLTGMLFYVTSADSGALVMANLSSRLRDAGTDGAPWLRVFWAAVTGALTLAMLLVGGVPTLQNATIIMGLPFSFVMFLVMLGLYRALRQESIREDSFRTSLTAWLSGRTAEGRGHPLPWRHRLARAMSYPGRRAAAGFLDGVCRPAMTEVAGELRAQGAHATVTEADSGVPGLGYLALVVELGERDRFEYQVWPVEAPTPAFLLRAQRPSDRYYRMEVHLTWGSQGYNLMGYSQDQVIGDILDQYERHLDFLRISHSQTEPPAESHTEPEPAG
ncbi:MAG: choline BCCT transporter BetT [Natronosporangium sp.]